jgi:mono/diheme cytochrome c family protein
MRAALARLRAGPAPVLEPKMREVLGLYTTHCINCHVIDGSGGSDGPDLSKIGGKLDPGAIERRIIDPVAVQPDAEMPAFGDKLTPEQIRALAQWLGTRR